MIMKEASFTPTLGILRDSAQVVQGLKPAHQTNRELSPF
jgi:hypothetical protein